MLDAVTLSTVGVATPTALVLWALWRIDRRLVRIEEKLGLPSA